MAIRAIFILLGLFVASSALADTYKWTDEDGVVHFSDRPHPGAEIVRLDKSRSRSQTARPTTSPAPDAEASGAVAQPFSYTSLEIVAPAAEETLWNIEGILNVSLALSPALQPNHEVRVYFDGVARTVEGTTFQLQEVYRGVHNIQAEVLDEAGNLMIRSLPNRFYVQQNTVRFR
ncbi:MAG: DUF4124 domain-containing protein [Gammaproteobacteria bacterium]|nr:DUF4124 domain-containing protein [Gammaproteobacteria bacterium]MDH3480571.1 DUF4124 domain-containing protein [Gammaproteobacteria bacterium]